VPAPENWVYEDHAVARWHAESNYQPVAFYPEPGLLALFPDRMLEIAPSRAYREDWRLLRGSACVGAPAVAADAGGEGRGGESSGTSVARVEGGVLASLRLVREKLPFADRWTTDRAGRLLVCGDHAILVRDRRAAPPRAEPLETLVPSLLHAGSRRAALALLDCEYTYMARPRHAAASGSTAFEVQLSTLPFAADGGSPEGSTIDLFGAGAWTFDHGSQQFLHAPEGEGGLQRVWAVESWEGPGP
jgi:hypothetical protein